MVALNFFQKTLAFFLFCDRITKRRGENMFAYVKGILEEKMSNYVVVETAGIGYKIFMSKNAILKIGELGDNVKIYTHYHVREDEISLYGFLTGEELKLFELLISVSGVGAKSAIAMLSNITPSEFIMCVVKNDITRLTKLPGIGQKSAQRIVLELKDKLKTEQETVKAEETENVIQVTDSIEEAISALQILGYNKKEIEKALQKFDYQSMTIEEIIRNGLKFLSK